MRLVAKWMAAGPTTALFFRMVRNDPSTARKSHAELAGDTLLPGSGLYQEKSFQGYVLPGITSVQPKKTPRGGKLTPWEKGANRRLASRRSRIEQAMGGVKRERRVKDNIRLLQAGIRDTLMETCCGLHNFRL